MIAALLLLAAGAAAERPTGDEKRLMLHCFARASMEPAWAAKPAGELGSDPAFAEFVSDRCDPEIVPLYARAYRMADEQLRGGGDREAALDRRRTAQRNIVLIVQEMLPAALPLRGKLPRMRPDEQRHEFLRWLFAGEPDDETAPMGRLYRISACVAAQPGGKGGGKCRAEALLGEFEAEFAARFPESDPAVTAELAREMLASGVMWAAVGGHRPPGGDGKSRSDAQD